MGKTLLESGDALAAGQKTTIEVPGNLPISAFELTLDGTSSGTALPVDDIADVTVKRTLPGQASRDDVQPISFSAAHRMAQSVRPGGAVDWTNVGGGDIYLVALIDQWVPTRPNNVMHVFGSEECVIEIDWGSLGNASALTYEVHARTNYALTEQYMRKLGTADLQMNAGLTKKRDTGANTHRLYLLDKSSVIKDNSIDVTEVVGGAETDHYQRQGFGDIEQVVLSDLNIPDTGILDQFTFAQIAEGSTRSEHINDRVHYEMEGSGSGTVYVVHDRVSFNRELNRRSVQRMSARQSPRVQRDPRPASANDVEAALLNN